MRLLKEVEANRTWQEIISWWETRRFLYNFIMLIIGFMSFFISFVTIPIVYIFIGFTLNILYTLGWIIELIFIGKLPKAVQKLYPTYAFYTYIILSTILVFGFAFGYFY